MADQAAGDLPAPTFDPKSSSDYIQFPCLPPGGSLNRWSTKITRGHDYPGAQVSRSAMASNPTTLTRLGHVIRSRCAKPGYDEECAPGRRCDSLVGRQSMQVSISQSIELIRLLTERTALIVSKTPRNPCMRLT